MPEPPERPSKAKTLPELIAETLELIARYVREQAGETMQKAVVRPLQMVSGYVALGIVAAALAGTGALFIAIGTFMALAALVGSTWAAFLIVGFSDVLLAVILVAVRLKFKQ